MGQAQGRSSRIRAYVASQELRSSTWSTLDSHSGSSRCERTLSSAPTNSQGDAAISTNPVAPQFLATSGTGVETTLRPAARYSGVLVGLIKRVAPFKAKGMKVASQPAR